jgi:hypothetical protein
MSLRPGLLNSTNPLILKEGLFRATCITHFCHHLTKPSANLTGKCEATRQRIEVTDPAECAKKEHGENLTDRLEKPHG